MSYDTYWSAHRVASCPLHQVDGIVVDTETGGPLRGVSSCALLEVAAVAIDRQRRAIGTVELPDGRALPGRWAMRILPDPGLLVTTGAIALNGYDRDLWRRSGAQPEASVLAAFGSWARAVMPALRIDWIAHNATFDREYLDAAWERSMAGHPPPWPDRHGWACSQQLHHAWLRLRGHRFESASLREAAQRIGWWTAEEAPNLHHGAQADAAAAAAVWWWTMQRLQTQGVAA